ncbi:MAG: acylphosphatase [Candidatus Shapirobacteria bacterium]|nr:acylphosphatase [Candidatus Shapirobacteria bacterium]MDD5073633.1 acylphosphatase [Candidatus Shapirobacteria bacterium]MDD5481406.1 acylphosphatase [Candidatus Shapirobacteria bacterium]
MIRVHVFISGRVQKVGFRFFAQQKAQRLGLIGWVRNRLDGRVETEVFGEEEKIAKLLVWFHQGSPLARVDDVEVVDRSKIKKVSLTDFQIKATK